MKRIILSALAILSFFFIYAQDKSFDTDVLSNPQPAKIIVEKGQTLLDFMDPSYFSDEQTDINPGIDPEGDFMLRSGFTKDGSKILVCNGGTDNVTVFDWETMQPEAIITVGNYPSDVAVTDEYAIVPCIFGDEIYVIDLNDYSIAGTFATPSGAQPCVVEVSTDENYAYVACDINDQCEVIDLENLVQLNPITDFPIYLISFSWISTGGRNSFKFSRFKVSPDENHIIVGNSDNDVLYINASTGNVDYSVPDIPNCKVVGLSGDGSKTIALSDFNNLFNAYQIDNATQTITGTVEITGNYLATFDVSVNMDGSKAFIGIGNNSSAIIRFETSDFVVFTQTYTPFWIGTSYDHQYAINGQYRFSIMDFASEAMLDQLQGYSQDFGCVSPVGNIAVGYDPLRYEGVYFFDFTDPSDIQFNGKELTGWPPEGDTPYRIAISLDGTKAVTSNSLSENMSIIDLTNYSVDTVIFLGEKSDAIGITHDSQWAIMGGYDLNTIKLINLTTNEFVTSVLTGQRPLMVGVSPDDAYAYIGNLKGNSVSFVELNGAASSEIVEINTGIIGLSWAAFGVRSSVEVDPTGQYILIAVSFEDKVQVIDIEQQQIVANLAVGSFPLKIAFNETGDYAAVTNYSSDSYSIINVDGANSSVVGTFPCNGDGPLRLAYNAVEDEFGIINYSTKTIFNIDPETGTINSTDSYTQYGNPVQVYYDDEGNPIVLTLSIDDDPGHLIRKEEAIVLPATPTYFDYCVATNTAVVCMPGPDYVTVVEFDQSTDPPIADFETNVTTIYVGQSLDFIDLSLNNPTSWDWMFEGGYPATSTDQNPTILYETQGTFDVSLTATNQYGSDTKTEQDYINVLPLTLVDEFGVENKFHFQPNPVKDILTVIGDGNLQGDFIASIFNSQGRFLISKKLCGKETTINLNGFESGMYFLRIGNTLNEKSYKFLKE